MRPLVRESLVFGSKHKLFQITASGVTPTAKQLSYSRRNRALTTDMLAMHTRSAIVGKWLGRAGSEASILSALGITP